MRNEISFALGFQATNLSQGAIDFFENNNAIKTEDGYALAYRESDQDLYGDLLNFDGTVSLGVINEQNQMYYPSDTLTKIFADDNSMEVSELDLTLPYALEDFVNSHMPEIQDEIKRIKEQYYPNDKAKLDLNPGTNVQTQTQVQTQAPAQEQTPVQTQTQAPANKAVAVIPSVNGEDDNSELYDLSGKNDTQTSNQDLDANLDVKADESVDTNDNLPAQTAVEAKPENHIAQGTVDPLLTLAADIFENNEAISFPKYDEYTHKQIQAQIVKSESTVFIARDEAIYTIYNILKAHAPKFEQEFEDDFLNSKQKHDLRLKSIETSKNNRIEKMEAAMQKEYMSNREKFVEAQRTILETNYDNDHLAQQQQRVNQERQRYIDEAEFATTKEKKDYQDHYKEERQRFLERRFRQIDIAQVLNDFEQVVHQETMAIEQEATQFANQVGVVTESVKKQQEAAELNAKSAQEQLNIFNKTMQEKIEARVEKEVQKRTSSLQQQLIDSQKRVTDAQNNIESLQKNNKALVASNEKLQTANDALNNIKIDRVPAPAPTPAPAVEPATEPAKKKNVWGLVAGFIVALVAVVIITAGVTTLVTNHNNQAQTTSVSSSQESVVSSSSAKDYQKGDTWTYSKDGHKYKVTMDNSTEGHYTDQDGRQHRITLTNE